MFKIGILDRILGRIKRLIPAPVFRFFEPIYHTLLAYGGAVYYGFPSKHLKVVGVTGTKGKSTTVYLVSKIFESTGHSVATIGSLGTKIKDKEWSNDIKMTMPGRMKIQKFMAEARAAGCSHVVMEVTSEGIKQKRHLGINFDCAVFTNLHSEHLESHGTFEAYRAAKQELFRHTSNTHVINIDDDNAKYFGDLSSKRKIFFGIKGGDLRAVNVVADATSSSFEVYGTKFQLNIGAIFNVYNAMAALAVGAMYGIDLPSMKPILESVTEIPGRMQYIQREPYTVIVDYAHTPDSLKAVYSSLRDKLTGKAAGRLICVLGAAGGGRDKWKRPEFGKIAVQYCDRIFLTNEDPYEEDPQAIIEQIAGGVASYELEHSQVVRVQKIVDRKAAIRQALTEAQSGDIVIITGKGSETTLAIDGKKLPWSDADVVRGILEELRR